MKSEVAVVVAAVSGGVVEACTRYMPASAPESRAPRSTDTEAVSKTESSRADAKDG